MNEKCVTNVYFLFSIIREIEQMLEKDINTNKQIGKYGGEDILSRNGNTSTKILTHCNTGSLATAGYGTALGKLCYMMIYHYGHISSLQ